MTGATLFSGIHAPEAAAPDIDWRFCAEIEPFPSAVGAFRHPHIPNLGDVTARDFIQRAKETLNGTTLDVLVFGSPCFPAGTLVLTDAGLRDISEIARGAMVLTHRQRWRKVLLRLSVLPGALVRARYRPL